MITLLTWNINYSKRAIDPYQVFDWNHRSDNLILKLFASNADIICLQQVHQDEKIDYFDDLYVLKIKYIMFSSKMVDNNYLVSLFDRDKFTIIGHRTINIEKSDLEVHDLTIIQHKKTKVELSIFNMYFPVNKAQRLMMAEKLIIDNSRPTIICGDFNTFPRWGGFKQMKLLKDKGLDEIALLINPLGKIVHKTFKAYPYDANNSSSYPLDHIMGRNIHFHKAICFNEDKIEWGNQKYGLSDHYPILVEFDF